MISIIFVVNKHGGEKWIRNHHPTIVVKSNAPNTNIMLIMLIQRLDAIQRVQNVGDLARSIYHTPAHMNAAMVISGRGQMKI